MDSEARAPFRWTTEEIDRFLAQPVRQIRTNWGYRLGLVLVALLLLFLQAVYLGMIAAAGGATVWYITRLPAIIASTNVNFITLILIAAPLVAGVVVTFFLFKPILARPAKPPEHLQLDPKTDPMIFAFVQRLCKILGTPKPTRIDVNLEVNASARFRRGWYSLHTTDLTLSIGLPLAAGLTVNQFAGVLAHEFGHFSQHAGMRLHFLIASIRRWFARVTYERDKWDVKLEGWRRGSGWRIRMILHVAYGTVQASRWVLRGLLYVANMASAWFSRQMEFDADRREAALVGAETFEETLSRLPVLSFSAQQSWQKLEKTWGARRLCDDFAQLVKNRDSGLPAEVRQNIIASTTDEKPNRWNTHPTAPERVANVSGQVGMLPGADFFAGRGEPHAESLFADFAGLCRQATLHHYQNSLGGELATAAVVPAAEFLASYQLQDRRLSALRSFFGPADQPARWFRLPEETFEGGEWMTTVAKEPAEEYWRLLTESLNRNSGLQFLRAGGKIKPESFHLSSGDLETAEREALASRTALNNEIAALGERFLSRGQLLAQTDSPFRSAYLAICAEQQSLLELRHRWVTLRVLRQNLRFLPSAAAANAFEVRQQLLSDYCDAILRRLAKVPSPITEDGDAPQTFAEQILLSDGASLSVEDRCARVLNRTDALAEETLGELCAEFAERTQMFTATLQN